MTWFRAGGGGGEDVSEEVAVQTPLIQQIREAIVGKATEANATAEHIEVGYSAYVGQVLIDGTLDPETLKKGEYVWKEQQAIIIHFTQEGFATIKVTSDDIDVSTLTIENFSGISGNLGNGGKYSFGSGGKLTLTNLPPDNGSVNFLTTYTQSAGTINIDGGLGIAFTTTWSDGVIKEGEVKYVVSDNESAYPDGGEKDGFWYEKTNDLSGLKKLFGCSEICVETFTYPSNRECKYSIPHSLGKIPKAVLIANNGSELSANYALISYLGIFNNGSSINGAAIYKYTGGNHVSEYSEGYITDSTITIGSGSLILEFYDAGVEYTLITMA